MTRDDEYWKRKLEELDMKINLDDRQDSNYDSSYDSTRSTASSTTNSTAKVSMAALQGLYQQSRGWFTTLPPIGKGVVAIGGGILVLSIIQTLVKVVTFGLSLLLFAVLAYGAYRFLNRQDNHLS